MCGVVQNNFWPEVKNNVIVNSERVKCTLGFGLNISKHELCTVTRMTEYYFKKRKKEKER